MPLYQYKARNKSGNVIEETIDAASRNDAANMLKADGLQVLTIKSLETKVQLFSRGKVSVSEKASFCRFVGTTLKAGLSLHEAAEIIKQESENKLMKKILAEMATEIRKGKSLSMILTQYPDVFDPVFITMVKAGEKSGSLDQTFDYLSKQLMASHELQQKIKGSLMYPAVVITAMLGVGTLMLVFVLPKIAEAFLKMKIELPPMTKVVLGIGQFVGQNTPLVLGLIGFSILSIVLIMTISATRKLLLNVLAKVPIIQKLLNQIDIAQFARTLATLLKSGVPIVEALNVSSGSLNQPKLKKQAKQFSEGVAKGESLAEVLGKAKKVFPLIMVQTIKTGEKTGSLEEVLKDLAEYYEGEVEHRLKRLTALLEPVLMLVIGVVIGGMVIMIIAPIYSVVGNLQSSMQK